MHDADFNEASRPSCCSLHERLLEKTPLPFLISHFIRILWDAKTLTPSRFMCKQIQIPNLNIYENRLLALTNLLQVTETESKIFRETISKYNHQHLHTTKKLIFITERWTGNDKDLLPHGTHDRSVYFVLHTLPKFAFNILVRCVSQSLTRVTFYELY